jgi:hypothetical protein
VTHSLKNVIKRKYIRRGHVCKIRIRIFEIEYKSFKDEHGIFGQYITKLEFDDMFSAPFLVLSPCPLDCARNLSLCLTYCGESNVLPVCLGYIVSLEDFDLLDGGGLAEVGLDPGSHPLTLRRYF